MPEMSQPAQGQPEVQAEGASKGPEEVIQDVHGGLMKLAGVVGKLPNAPQGAGERLAAMAEEFKALVDALAQGGAPQGDQGNVPMEAGNNPNAKPVM